MKDQQYYFVDMLGHEESGYENYPVRFGTREDLLQAVLVALFYDADDATEYVDWLNEELDMEELDSETAYYLDELEDIEELSGDDETVQEYLKGDKEE